jgi:alpha-tubulin suppressor-like RCC1 family protein
MALNFPDNPTPGQQYTDPNNLIWEFNGVVWTPITGTVGTSGFSGFSGYSGYSGTSGYSGINGISGFSGTSSATISASDEGNLLTSIVSGFNFAGTNVVTTNVGGAVTVTIEPPIVYINSAWVWGAGGNGSRGDNISTGCTSSPGSVVGGFTDWCQISVGGWSTLATGFGFAVRTNGTLWGWGYAGGGRLGNNCTTNRSSPVSVVGGFTDWCQVSTFNTFSSVTLAVRQNGTAWAWGSGYRGQLGDNTTVDKSSPVSVVGGFTDWCQVSSGNYFTLGVRTNGTAWAWGKNNNGQLGDNTTVSKSSPVSVVGGFTNWCQIRAGGYFSLGVRTNGTAWAWGCGLSGRLGDNTTDNKSSPVSVIGGFTDWCQISAGGAFSLAVRQNGTAWGWGCGAHGSLGNNSTVDRSSPVSVVGGFTNWCQVATGYRHSIGVRQSGTAWAWGCGGNGRLGDNTTVDKSSPVSVVGGFTDWCQVSATYGMSAGIRSTAT